MTGIYIVLNLLFSIFWALSLGDYFDDVDRIVELQDKRFLLTLKNSGSISTEMVRCDLKKTIISKFLYKTVDSGMLRYNYVEDVNKIEEIENKVVVWSESESIKFVELYKY